MKQLPATLLVAVGFAAGLVLGCLLPWVAADNSRAATSSEEKKTNGAGVREDAQTIAVAGVDPEEPSDLPLTVSDLATELQRLREIEVGSEAEIKGWDYLRARLRAADLSSLAKDMVEAYPEGTSDELLDMVFSELANQKPDEAWQMLMDLKSPQLRRQIGWSVCSVMANKDINKALILVNGMPESQFKVEMRQTALNTLASRDPAKAFAFEVQYAGDRPDFDPNFWEWVRVDPDAAIRATDSLQGAAFKKATENLLGALAQRDPQKAWLFAQSLPAHDGDPWSDPLYTTLSSWGTVDPQAAVSAAMSLSDADLRARSVAQIARSWSDADFPSALRYVLALPDTDLKSEALAEMAWSSGQASKQELFMALVEHGPVGNNVYAANIMEGWARQDPVSAAAALAQLPPSSGLDETTTHFVRGWLSSSDADPTDIFSWVRSLPEKTSAREQAAVAFFEEIGRRDAQSGAKLLAGLDAATQKSASAGLAEGWSSTSPEEAAAWTLQLPPEKRTAAVRAVVSNWARRDPIAAAEFAARNDSNGDFVSTVVDEWLPGSPQQATAWVESLPRGDVRDAGLAKVAEIVWREDPSAAVLWASRISSASRRENELQSICSRWIRIDPIGATSWIQNSTLPPKVKSSLLAR